MVKFPIHSLEDDKLSKIYFGAWQHFSTCCEWPYFPVRWPLWHPAYLCRGGGGGGESVQIVKGKSVCVSVFKLLSLLQVIFIYHLWYVFSLFTISAVIFLSNINFSSFVYYFLVFHIFYYVVCFRLKLFFPPSTVTAHFKNNERKNGKHVFLGYFTEYWSRT